MKNDKGINSSELHIIAMITMLIDHIGYVFYPSTIWLRCIGRIAFPIYAFLLTEGYHKTSNKYKYVARIFLIGIISEIPYNYMTGNALRYSHMQNVMFELVLGLVILELLNKIKHNKDFWVIKICYGLLILILMSLAKICNLDGGVPGVLLIITFEISRCIIHNKIFELISIILLFGIMFDSRMVWIIPSIIGIKLQTFRVASLPFIWKYNGEKGINSRWFKWITYLFYPIHITFLVIIKHYIA